MNKSEKTQKFTKNWFSTKSIFSFSLYLGEINREGERERERI